MKKLYLQLFAEGGDGGASGENANGNDAGSKGLLSNVRYGKQRGAAGSEPAEDRAKDSQTKFDELIKGEYKERFHKRTQEIIDNRFKETKALERYRNNMDPIVELLYQKYGVSDLNSLQEEINNDSSYWEDRAEREGLTVEQYKTKQRLEAENSKLRRMQEQQVRERQAAEQYQLWIYQGEEAKKEYPDLDLEQESKNPDFVDLLTKGLSVQNAYEVIHMDDIKKQSAQARQKRVVNSVRANGLRPSENGVGGGQGIVTKTDVSRLTKADRAEIAKRVARGEHIEF